MNLKRLLLLDVPAAAVVAAATVTALGVAGITGLASSTTPTTTALVAVPVGYTAVAYVSSSTGQATAFTDARSNTWTLTGSALLLGSVRFTQWRSIITTQIQIGDTFGPTFGSAQSCDLIVVAFSCTSFDDVATTGATATSTAPSLTLSSLDATPEIVCYTIRSSGGLASLAASGYTQLKTAQSGNFGMQCWYKQVTGVATYTDTFAPTGHTNVAWLLLGTSMVV